MLRNVEGKILKFVDILWFKLSYGGLSKCVSLLGNRCVVVTKKSEMYGGDKLSSVAVRNMIHKMMLTLCLNKRTVMVKKISKIF